MASDSDRDGAPNELSKSLAKADKRLREDAEICRKKLPDSYPRLKKEEFKSLLPSDPRYDHIWTEEDEAKLLDDWQADPERKTTQTPNASLQALWRTCARFMKCLPSDIISPAHHLEYDISVSRGGLMRNWPSTFNRPLQALLVHPIWKREKALLAMAIQYSVIVRTGDRRKWPLVNHTLDIFFDCFQSIIHDDQDNLSIERLHAKVRAQLAQHYPSRVLPIWSDLLRAIEKKTAHDSEPISSQTPSNPFEPYKVKKKDLDNLIEALDSLSAYEFPFYQKTEVISAVIQGPRSAKDLPNKNDMPKYRERVVLSEKRKAAREKKLARMEDVRLKSVADVDDADLWEYNLLQNPAPTPDAAHQSPLALRHRPVSESLDFIAEGDSLGGFGNVSEIPDDIGLPRTNEVDDLNREDQMDDMSEIPPINDPPPIPSPSPSSPLPPPTLSPPPQRPIPSHPAAGKPNRGISADFMLLGFETAAELKKKGDRSGHGTATEAILTKRRQIASDIGRFSGLSVDMTLEISRRGAEHLAMRGMNGAPWQHSYGKWPDDE